MNIKLLLTGVTFLVLTFSSKAQDVTQNSSPKFYLQANGGVTQSSSALFAFMLPRFNVKTGINTGIDFGYQFHKRFFAESGLHYNQKGYKTTFDLTTTNNGNLTSVTQEQTVSYLSIPFGIGFQLGNKVQFFAKQSISADFMLSNRVDVLSTTNNETTEETYRENNYNVFDISLITAIGLNIPIKQYYVGVNANYNTNTIGLRSKNSAANKGFKLPAYSFNLQVGYRF